MSAQRRKGSLSGKAQLERFAPNIDSQGGLWPAEFKFNPWTGEALEAALTPLAPVAGRFGSPSGLPLLETATASVQPGPSRAEALPKGAFHFGQGGQPGFLFAVDPKAGVVFRKTRLENGWIDHGHYRRSHLDPWAGGLAARADGVYYSADDRLVRINEDPEDDGEESWRLGPMVSGPALLQDTIVAPFMGEEGLSVIWLTPAGGVHKTKAASAPGALVDPVLAAPAIGAGGVIYWMGQTGFLTFQLIRGNPEAVWRAWPVGFQAKPFLRPYRAPNGFLWAFGVGGDDATLGRSAACELSAADNVRPVRWLDGPHISAGEGTYRNKAHHQRPWAEPDESIQVGLDLGDRWLLPLAAFPNGDAVVALVEDSASMRSFLFREGSQAPRRANLFLHRRNAGLASLQHALDLTSTDDLDVFVVDGRLNLYNRDINECVSWPLA